MTSTEEKYIQFRKLGYDHQLSRELAILAQQKEKPIIIKTNFLPAPTFLNDMICYKDKTFCSSETHKPDCDRQITEEDKKHAEELSLPIAYGKFCE